MDKAKYKDQHAVQLLANLLDHWERDTRRGGNDIEWNSWTSKLNELNRRRHEGTLFNFRVGGLGTFRSEIDGESESPYDPLTLAMDKLRKQLDHFDSGGEKGWWDSWGCEISEDRDGGEYNKAIGAVFEAARGLLEADAQLSKLMLRPMAEAPLLSSGAIRDLQKAHARQSETIRQHQKNEQEGVDGALLRKLTDAESNLVVEKNLHGVTRGLLDIRNEEADELRVKLDEKCRELEEQISLRRAAVPIAEHIETEDDVPDPKPMPGDPPKMEGPTWFADPPDIGPGSPSTLTKAILIAICIGGVGTILWGLGSYARNSGLAAQWFHEAVYCEDCEAMQEYRATND